MQCVKKELTLCCMCRESTSQYTCPRCGGATCSLHCSKRHKTLQGCSGTRVDYCLEQEEVVEEANSLADLYFLDRVHQSLETAKRIYSAIDPGCLDEDSSEYLLSQQCSKRKTTLFRCPVMFQRRRKNSSYYSQVSKTVMWKISLTFFSCDVPLVVEEDKIPEVTRLSDIITRYTAAAPDGAVIPRMARYAAAGLDGIRCFVESWIGGEQTEKKIRYLELDCNKKLRECVEKIAVCEFPHFFIVLKDLKCIRAFKQLYGRGGKIQTMLPDKYKSRRSLEAEAELGSLDVQNAIKASIPGKTKNGFFPIPGTLTSLSKCKTNGRYPQKVTAAMLNSGLPLGIVSHHGGVGCQSNKNSISSAMPFRSLSPSDLTLKSIDKSKKNMHTNRSKSIRVFDDGEIGVDVSAGEEDLGVEEEDQLMADEAACFTGGRVPELLNWSDDDVGIKKSSKKSKKNGYKTGDNPNLIPLGGCRRTASCSAESGTSSSLPMTGTTNIPETSSCRIIPPPPDIDTLIRFWYEGHGSKYGSDVSTSNVLPSASSDAVNTDRRTFPKRHHSMKSPYDTSFCDDNDVEGAGDLSILGSSVSKGRGESRKKGAQGGGDSYRESADDLMYPGSYGGTVSARGTYNYPARGPVGPGFVHPPYARGRGYLSPSVFPPPVVGLSSSRYPFPHPMGYSRHPSTPAGMVNGQQASEHNERQIEGENAVWFK